MPSEPFEKRAHLLKREAEEALKYPAKFAALLSETHKAQTRGNPRLQIRISGPTLEVLETVKALRKIHPPKSIGLSKNFSDMSDRTSEMTGDTLRAYMNYTAKKHTQGPGA